MDYQQFKINIINIYTNGKSNPVIIITLVITFFILIFAIGTSSVGFEHVSDDIRHDFKHADTTRDSMVMKNANRSLYTKALANQYVYLRRLKEQYVEVAAVFDVYYFNLVTVLLVASTFSAIIVALIARKGWDAQGVFIKSLFVGLFITASLSALMIKVFNNSDNATKNINKYFYLTNLQTNIYEVLATDTSNQANGADTVLLNVFRNNNKSLKDNTDLFLDIKAQDIPATADVSKVLK